MTRAALTLIATFGVFTGNAAAANLPADTTAILSGNSTLTAPLSAPISDSFESQGLGVPVMARFEAPAGKTRSSPATGATLPCQFVPVAQFPFVAPVHVFVVAAE